MGHYIGIDFHKQFSSLAVMDDKGQIMDERKLYHDNQPELVQYFSQFSPGTSVSLEATRNWYWLVDLLQELNLDVKLVHAKKARIIAENTIKTDKIDARILAHLDRCNFLPQAYIANQQTRNQRELLRYHLSLVKIQTSIKNRIHAVLAKHNIQHGFTDLFGKSGIEFLKDLPLSKIFRLEINGYLELLKNLADTLKGVKKEITTHCQMSPESTLLDTIPGIGVLGALLLAAEIADIHRFKTVKKFCCYGGFASSTHQSADTLYHGKIIKDSNKYIRYILIEAIHHAVKKDPRLWRFYNKIQRTKGTNKAKIATGRKLLVAIYHMLKNKQPYRIGQNNFDTRVNPCAKLGTSW